MVVENGDGGRRSEEGDEVNEERKTKGDTASTDGEGGRVEGNTN